MKGSKQRIIELNLVENTTTQNWKLLGLLWFLLTFTISYSFANSNDDLKSNANSLLSTSMTNCTTPDLAPHTTTTNGLSTLNNANITVGNAVITGTRTFGGNGALDEDVINASQTTGVTGIRQGLLNSLGAADYMLTSYSYSQDVCNHSISIWDVDRSDAMVITGYNNGTPVSYTVSHLGSNVAQSGNTFTSTVNVQAGSLYNEHRVTVDFNGCIDQLDIKFYNFDGSTNTGGSYTTSWGEGCEGNSDCLLYTSPSPRDATLSRMPSSA